MLSGLAVVARLYRKRGEFRKIIGRPVISDRLYLDHAASMPILSEVRDVMAEAMKIWANPSSPHAAGRAAKAALEEARNSIKTAISWDDDIIFTSGASEAIAIALGCDQPIFASAVEHDAVRGVAKDASILPVASDGYINPAHIAEAGRYAIQTVNSETGVIQPAEAIAAAIKTAGGVWLADASQSAGKIPLPDADLIVVSAHKFGGPPGIGALLVKDLALLKPTGGQEQGYRRGTENLISIMGFAEALNINSSWLENAATLREKLDKAIIAEGGQIVAESSQRLPTIAGYRMPDVSANSQLISFDMTGICVSAGSACSSGSLKASHVLTAMGWDAKAAGEVVRVSIGPETNEADIDRFLETWISIKERVTR